MAWKASGPRDEMERHGAPKSAGLAGMSSEVRLGDGWLVCSALLLEWSKLKLIRSIGRIFYFAQKHPPPPPPTTSTSTSTTTTKTTPYAKGLRLDSPLRCCCGCSCCRRCWLLLLLLLLVVLAGHAAGNGVSSLALGLENGAAVSAYLLLVCCRRLIK